MAQIVVRSLNDDVKLRLKRRARRHGRSVEAEVRDILANAVKDDRHAARALGSRLAARFAGIGLEKDISELRGQPARSAKFAP